VKQDWLSLTSVPFVLFFYAGSVNKGQMSPNVQQLVWLLDVKEIPSDDKFRVSKLIHWVHFVLKFTRKAILEFQDGS
jgi:hypothetical protein